MGFFFWSKKPCCGNVLGAAKHLGFQSHKMDVSVKIISLALRKESQVGNDAMPLLCLECHFSVCAEVAMLISPNLNK